MKAIIYRYNYNYRYSYRQHLWQMIRVETLYTWQFYLLIIPFESTRNPFYMYEIYQDDVLRNTIYSHSPFLIDNLKQN